MSKLFEDAVAKARQLPEDEQDALAELLMSLSGLDASVVPLDATTRAAIREGLEQAERGEFVDETVVAAADRRHGI